MNSRQLVSYILLCCAIVSTSFCLEIGFYPFLQDTILDYRSTKETLALFFSAALVLWAICGQHKIECKNPWLAALIFYLAIHPIFSPKFNMMLDGHNIGGFWEYKPIVTALLYFGVFCVVSNLRWADDFIKNFFKILMWIGVISSCYIFLQYLNLDQFQHLYSIDYALLTHGGKMTATFTQPNYSGSFIALMIPFALYFRRWWKAAIMALAVILITSRMGMLVMVIGVTTYCFYRWRSITIVVGSFAIFISLTFWQLFWPTATLSSVDSGRSGLWVKVIHDCTHPWIAQKAFPILGHGLDFYRNIWTAKHPNEMLAVHNEWLQLWMDGGLLACALLIFSIFWLLKRINIYRLKDDQTVALLACFLGSLGGSCGLFLWQIEPHRLLTVVIFALLHRKLTMEGQYETA